VAIAVSLFRSASKNRVWVLNWGSTNRDAVVPAAGRWRTRGALFAMTPGLP